MKMKNEGKVDWYLSVKYDRDPISGAVSASQELYINQILKKWGLENCNSLPTPFPSKMDTYLEELAKPVDTLDPSLKKDYQSLIGQLLYLQAHTVPEISWTVSQLSRYKTAKLLSLSQKKTDSANGPSISPSAGIISLNDKLVPSVTFMSLVSRDPSCSPISSLPHDQQPLFFRSAKICLAPVERSNDCCNTR